MATGNDRLSKIRDYLATAGFTLMAREWCDVSSPYRFRCESGHASSQSGASLLRLVRGTRGLLRCRQCWIEQTMTRIHETAGSAGGQCLSKRYRGKSAHYRFVCAAGHKFEATAASVLTDHWCAKCSTERRAERRRYQGGLKPIQDRARERGGECLSTAYDGRMAKYRFRCGAGHEWEAAGYDVLRKAWCQECSSDRKRIPDGLAKLQERAAEHGGRCLASQYQRIQARYPFQCERGHEWMAWGTEILKGHWCPTCRTEDRQRQGLELMRSIAADRGGMCVSEHYVDNNSKLEWECARGHRWWARPRQVSSAGNWCAQCQYLSQITLEKTRRKRRYEAVKSSEP